MSRSCWIPCYALHGAAAWRCRSRFRVRNGPDVDLYCFSGEMRQLFANLIGNAIDAMAPGRASVAVFPPVSFVGGRHTRYSIVCRGQWLRHDRGHAAADFRAIFYHQGNDGNGAWLVGERRDHRQAQRHGAGGQPCGGSADGKQSGTVFMLFFPEDGIGIPPLSSPTAVTQTVKRGFSSWNQEAGASSISARQRRDGKSWGGCYHPPVKQLPAMNTFPAFAAP